MILGSPKSEESEDHRLDADRAAGCTRPMNPHALRSSDSCRNASQAINLTIRPWSPCPCHGRSCSARAQSPATRAAADFVHWSPSSVGLSTTCTTHATQSTGMHSRTLRTTPTRASSYPGRVRQVTIKMPGHNRSCVYCCMSSTYRSTCRKLDLIVPLYVTASHADRWLAQ